MNRHALATIAAGLFFFSAAAKAQTCPTTPATLIAPANGATMQSPVTFNWTAVGGATAYRVWLSVDGVGPVNFARITSTTATLPVPNGAIDWFVEALFDTCQSVISAHSKFSVTRSASCDSAGPILTSPINTDVQAPVTFKWSPTPNASAYRVWVAINGDAFTDLGFTTDTQLKRDLDPGSYTWYVDAIYAGCPSVASAQATFRVPNEVANCSGATPVIVSPVNGANGVMSPVTLSWTPVAGATDYRVFASINGGSVQLVAKTGDTSLKRAIPAGNVVWFVEAAFNGCAATHSQPARFTVVQSSCPTTKAQLLTPPDDSTNNPSSVTFSWAPVAGAVTYVLIAKAPHGAPTAIGQTSATQLVRDVPAGDIEWWVVALGSGCNGTVSEHFGFTVPNPANCTAKRPRPLQPEDDAVNEASPVRFVWTAVAGATSYKVFAATGDNEPALIATSTTNEATVPMPAGRIKWYVEALFDACPALFSAANNVTVSAAPPACSAPPRPVSHVAAQVIAGTDYNVRWTGVAGASVYELQEATKPDFSDARTIAVSGVKWPTTKTNLTAPVVYYYRVRALSDCGEERSSYSKVVTTRVVPSNTVATHNRATAEIGAQNAVVQTVQIPASAAGQTFTAMVDKPWLTVTPSSGTVPQGGMTLSVSGDPKTLNVGANQASVKISYTTPSSGRKTSNANTPPTTVPISISLVTPVTPDTKATPPPDSLIIPAVGHAAGANASLFQSDIRVANVSSQAMKYLVNFTPTATDGTQTGTTTTIQVDPGSSTALDDILASFFGTATDSNALGMLEIRPLSNSDSSSLFSNVPSSVLSTIASSRTYNVTSAGTFGQFIPAIPFSQFVGKGSVLSLQQIAQSTAYRTNFGLLEAAGEPASVLIHVFDKSGNRIADIPESLLPSEHLALNGLLSANNISLDDGRVEVEVTSTTGKVSAYASVLDNRTNDPLLVSPVIKGSVLSNRYVIPGIAYTNSIANWRSDARLFNSGSTTVNATMTFYPQAGSADMTPLVRTTTIAPGETKVLDNVLNATFGINSTNAGGSLVVTTSSTSSIIATARTYAAVENGGTIGQFVPAVTPSDSVGSGDRSLQLLQLENSDQFRTNIGVAETTGNPATVEVSLVLPDSKVTPVLSIPLAANEFIQLPLASFGLTDSIYNARVSVQVVDGAGKVTAYGSLIDNVSQDPTYVPAQ